MSEGLPGNGEGQNGKNKPFWEGAVIAGAKVLSKRTGKPMVVILNVAEREAEQDEKFFFKNLYNKVKNKIVGN